jgi:hypothetical protein
MPNDDVTLCAIFRVPAEGLTAFQEYEAAVLSLLQDHHGELQRRLRNGDGTTEVHVIRFSSSAALDGYRADPRRTALAHLFVASGAVAEVLTVADVSCRD